LQDVRPLLDPLTASFDLLAWDYRGFGRSAPVTHAYTMADVAADAAGLLEITGWESCRVVGASFGGMVAQEFAVTYPQRVGRPPGVHRIPPDTIELTGGRSRCPRSRGRGRLCSPSVVLAGHEGAGHSERSEPPAQVGA
jgi:hypothetical protein